jgi:uncharacterized protein
MREDARMDIEVGSSPVQGRGLFATRTIKPGTCVEVSPVLLIPPEQVDPVDETVFSKYVFDWDGSSHALVLGKASMCNHDPEPNTELYLGEDETGPYAELVVIHRLKSGDELFIDYGPDHPL